MRNRAKTTKKGHTEVVAEVRPYRVSSISEQRKRVPVDQLLLGLSGFAITKVIQVHPPVFEVICTSLPRCPHCDGWKLRTKDSFWRELRSILIDEQPSRLRIKCHKYCCLDCGRYFNSRLEGVKKWSRTTEKLKRNIFIAYNKGVSCQDIAEENGMGVASVERYYHQIMQQKLSHWQNQQCPRILGIDEHRFTRKQGFLTTFCDLAKRRVFDVVKGRSAGEMIDYLRALPGKEKVKIVCIDMNSAYRKLVRDWFPNARIVTDRFHVIRLVNQHFSELCKTIDEKRLAYGRGGLMRLMLKKRENLTILQKERLREYFFSHPVMEPLYDFMHNLNDLLRNKSKNQKDCRLCIVELLEKIEELRKTAFAPLRKLGKTLHNWREEVARMFRFTKNNGITEGFHRKMKLIQRRAYGFRNFENYRLRVRVLCC